VLVYYVGVCYVRHWGSLCRVSSHDAGNDVGHSKLHFRTIASICRPNVSDTRRSMIIVLLLTSEHSQLYSDAENLELILVAKSLSTNAVCQKIIIENLPRGC